MHSEHGSDRVAGDRTLAVTLGGCALAFFLIPALATVWAVIVALGVMAFLVDLHNPQSGPSRRTLEARTSVLRSGLVTCGESGWRSVSDSPWRSRAVSRLGHGVYPLRLRLHHGRYLRPHARRNQARRCRGRVTLLPLRIFLGEQLAGDAAGRGDSRAVLFHRDPGRVPDLRLRRFLAREVIHQ